MRGLCSVGKQCDATDRARFRLLSRRADHFALSGAASGLRQADLVFLRRFGMTVIDLSQSPLRGDTASELNSLDDVVDEIHRQLVEASRSLSQGGKMSGKLLLKLRERIENGDAGDISWWQWYLQHFVHSPRDAEKVIAHRRL
jgi:hypothetical protein